MTDTSEIVQLVLRERQGRDRGWWEQMAETFHPDSLVSLSWFTGSGADFVTRSRAMSERGIRPLHRLCPPVVYLHGHRAVVEVPSAIELRFPLHGVEADITSYSRLLYRVGQHEGRWKIQGLTAIYERDTLMPAVPGETLDIKPELFSGFRKPYRCLAYQLSLAGQSAGDDLYGDDQPERVNELYEATFRWAHE